MTDTEKSEMIERLTLQIDKLKADILVTGESLPDELKRYIDEELTTFHSDLEKIIQSA